MTEKELLERYNSTAPKVNKKTFTADELLARYNQTAPQPIQPVPTPVTQPQVATTQPTVSQPTSHAQRAKAGYEQATNKFHVVEPKATPMTDKLNSGATLTPEEVIELAREQGKITNEEAKGKLNELKEPLKSVKIEGKDKSWTLKDDVREFKDTLDTIGKGTVVFGKRALDAANTAKNYLTFNDTTQVNADSLVNYAKGKRDSQSKLAYVKLKEIINREDRQDDAALKALFDAVENGSFSGTPAEAKSILEKSQTYYHDKAYRSIVQPSLEKYEQKKKENIENYPGIASQIMNTGADVLSYGVPTVLGMKFNPTAGLALSGSVAGENKMQQYLEQGKSYSEAAKNIPIETAKGIAFAQILEVARPVLSSGITPTTPTLARAGRAFANGLLVGTGASAATQTLDLLKEDPNYDYIDWNKVENGLKTGEYKTLDDYLISDEYLKDVAGSRAKQMAISALMTASFNTVGQVKQGMKASQAAKATQANIRAKADEYLKTLGLKRGATEEQVRRAARQLSAQFHPDRNPGFEEQFNQVRTAYAELSKPEFAFVYGKGVVPTTVSTPQQPVNTTNAVASDQALVPYAGQAVASANNIGNVAVQQTANMVQPRNNVDIMKPEEYNVAGRTQYATIAPYRANNITEANIDQSREAIEKQFVDNANGIANALGIQITNTSNNMGGFMSQEGPYKGQAVNELSYTFELGNATPEQADMFARLVGDLGNEVQEAVIASNYVDFNDTAATALEIDIKVNDLENITDTLKAAGIEDYTIDRTNNQIKLLVFGEKETDKLDNLIKGLGGNYGGFKETKVNSRYIGREDRQNAYGEWLRTSGEGKQNRQLRDYISKALKAVENDLQKDKQNNQENSNQSSFSLPTNEELKEVETPQDTAIKNDTATLNLEKPKATRKTTPRQSNKIGDFGEKIGGARKDISIPTERKTKQVIPNYTVEPEKIVGDDGKETESYSVKFKGKKLSDGFKTQQEAVDFINNFKNHVKQNAAVVEERTALVRKTGEKKTMYEVSVVDPKTLKKRSTGKYFDKKEDAEEFALALSMYVSEHGKNLFRPTLQRVERYNPAANNSTKATGQEILDRYKFRAGEFGNWVNNKERQKFLNYGYDALNDLATAMEVAPEDISFGGKMAIAFGARGHGLSGASAHFEPVKKVFNMTKLKGAGSAAHEMGHGFDNYLSQLSGYDPDGMLSSSRRYKNLPKPIQDSFEHLLDVIQYSISTDEEEINKKNSLFEKARKEHLDYHLSYYDKVFRGEATRYKKVKGEYKNVPIEVTEEQKKEYQRIRKILEEGKLDSKREYDLKNTGRDLKSVVTYGDDIEKLKSMIKEVTGRKIEDDDIYWIYRYGQPAEQVKEVRSKSAFSKSAEELDKFFGRADRYHSKIEEMLARSFEAFIFDELKKKGVSSQYLVHSVYNDNYALFNPFPAGEERVTIDKAWRDLINTMKQEGFFHEGEKEITPLADHDTNRGYADEETPTKPRNVRKTTTTVNKLKTDLQAERGEIKSKESPKEYNPEMLPPNEEIQKVDKKELLPTTDELKQFEKGRRQAEIEAVRKGAKALGLEKEPTPPKEPPKPPIEPPTESEEIPDVPDDKTAKLLKEKPEKAKMTKKEIAENAYKTLVNKGYHVDKLSEESGNPQLKYKYDRMLASANEGNYAVGEKQTDNEGNIIGKSVNEIWKPIEDAGKVEEFSDYLLHKLNIDRMSLEDIDAITKADTELTDFIKNNPEIGGLSPNKLKKLAKGDDANAEKARQLIELDRQAEILENRKNKPVFGDSVTADDSRRIVAEYEEKNPEFVEWAKDINTFNKNQLQNMVDAGLASEETQQLLNDMYDNYIRIQRQVGGDRPITNQRGRLKVNSPIKKAKGGNQDILPLKDSMAQQTVEVKKAISRNLFGRELLNTLGGGEKVEDYGEILKKGKNGEAPTFTVFVDGEPVTMKINNELYDAIKPSERTTWEDSVIAHGLQKAVVLQKTLLTSRNPIFAFTNFVRDLQTAIVNSTDTPKMLENYKKLAQFKFAQTFGKELTDEQREIGRLWELYKANGGESNTYFDFEKGTKLESSNPVKRGIDKVTDKIFGVNEIVEQMPRVAEFITTLENGGTIDEAMYNAADITVNFKRGGEFTKMLDRNGASFLNASVQGLDKQIRNFSKKRGGKGFAKMVITCALLGIAPQLLNHMLLSDDEDYQDLPDYIKDNYWLLKTGDDTFIRIPRGRDIPTFLGVLAQRTKRATEGDEHAFDGLVDTFSNTLAPNNPTEDNVFAPFAAVKTNKSWNGSDIVSTTLQNKVPSQQYDAKDTEFAKWLGEKINVAPKKIDYLLDQYSGGLGDILIPMNTKYAEGGNALSSKFTTDSINSNKQLSRFYDDKTELTQKKNSNVATEQEKYQYKYFTDVGEEISEINKQIREIELSDDTDKQKISRVTELRKQMNQLAKEANSNSKKYGEVANDYSSEIYKNIFNSDLYKDSYDQEKFEEKIRDKVSEDANSKAKEALGEKGAANEIDTIIEELEDASIPLADYYLAWYAKNNLAQGKKYDSQRKAIRDNTNLTSKQEEVLFGIFNIQGK